MMSENNSPPSLRLLHVPVSGLSTGAALIVACALGLLVLQTMSLLDGINPSKNIALQLIPGAGGLVLLILVVMSARRKGYFSVFPDHVEGKRVNGLAYTVALSAVSEVEIKAHALALKGENGNLLLLLGKLGKKTSGLVWLLRAYDSWEPVIWQSYVHTESPSFQKATRHFLDDDGKASFGDIGFLVPMHGVAWYFPESPIIDLSNLGAGQLRMNQRAGGQSATPIQLYPQPDWLPLEQLCNALTNAKLEKATMESHLAELAETHGGNLVASVSSSEEYHGECLGYKVQIQPA
jgi:hypothetical protein